MFQSRKNQIPKPDSPEHFELPEAGSASPEIAKLAVVTWIDAAAKAGIDLTNFRPDAPLAARLAWAQGNGLEIGTTLSRFSSKLQHSTPAQVHDNVQFAANHKTYVPPEFVCVDEATTGSKLRRDGFDRVKLILQQKLAKVLLVFKVSRLFRLAYRGFQFFQEDIVDEDLRAFSISQGIDTSDAKTWKVLAYLHGIMDELLLSTIADHVRSGIGNLFRNGFVVGAAASGLLWQRGARCATDQCRWTA